MHNSKMTTAAFGVAASLLLGTSAGAQVAYNSLGFEVPTSGFGFAGLEGQAGGSPQRTFVADTNTSDSATATVSGGVGTLGSDGVSFEIQNSFNTSPSNPSVLDVGQYAVTTAPGGVVPTDDVVVSLDISPFFTSTNSEFAYGFSVYGAPSGGPLSPDGAPLTLDVVITTDDGSVFVGSGSDAFTDTGVDVPLATVAAAYSNFEVSIDYTAKMFDLAVNSLPVGTFDFRTGQSGVDVDSSGRTNDYAGVLFLGFEVDPNSTSNVDGLAYYDNLVVIPEPTTLALASLAGVGLLRRRRA